MQCCFMLDIGPNGSQTVLLLHLGRHTSFAPLVVLAYCGTLAVQLCGSRCRAQSGSPNLVQIRSQTPSRPWQLPGTRHRHLRASQRASARAAHLECPTPTSLQCPSSQSPPSCSRRHQQGCSPGGSPHQVALELWQQAGPPQQAPSAPLPGSLLARGAPLWAPEGVGCHAWLKETQASRVPALQVGAGGGCLPACGRERPTRRRPQGVLTWLCSSAWRASARRPGPAAAVETAVVAACSQACLLPMKRLLQGRPGQPVMGKQRRDGNWRAQLRGSDASPLLPPWRVTAALAHPLRC